MANLKHGQCTRAGWTRLYRAWAKMHARCASTHKDYGGKGVRVCAQWKDFERFAADVGPHPGKGWTLDRWPDNDGDYRRGNVRWATREMQVRNRRTTKLTDDKAEDIRRRYRAGNKWHPGNRELLAHEFNVHPTTISHIAHGKRWS